MTDHSAMKFKHETNATNELIRLMAALGVIHPRRTDTGWRIFSDADIVAAKKWMAVNYTPRTRKPTAHARARATG
jgi:hypothetical protein